MQSYYSGRYGYIEADSRVKKIGEATRNKYNRGNNKDKEEDRNCYGLTSLVEFGSVFYLFSYLPSLITHIVLSFMLLCFSLYYMPVWLHTYL
jgi:hypothetical protein